MAFSEKKGGYLEQFTNIEVQHREINGDQIGTKWAPFYDQMEITERACVSGESCCYKGAWMN